MAREIDDHMARIVAAYANVDVRTLRRILDGAKPRSEKTRDAIVAALKQHRFYSQAKAIGAK